MRYYQEAEPLEFYSQARTNYQLPITNSQTAVSSNINLEALSGSGTGTG